MSPNDTDEERAREIIEKLLITGQNEVVRIERTSDQVLVFTQGINWSISPPEADLPKRALDGYELYTVDSYAYRNPPPLRQGVARLPDGRMFLLNDAEQLRAFFTAMGGALPPADLAGLLVRFQLGSTTAPYQSLVLTPEDLAEKLEPEQIAAIPELIPLQTTPRADGGLDLDFCAHLRGRRGAPDEGWISVVRWHVEVSASHALTWSSRTIAERLAPRSWKELGILDIIMEREKKG
ncbi:hypothetical protein A7982_12596 [Minicystis rosea]|nr:hypothetical protein A7982_12596 [Minicystis rosea]